MGQMYFPTAANMGPYAAMPQGGGVDMEEKPIGALGVIAVLALTILVLWLGVYALFLARG